MQTRIADLSMGLCDVSFADWWLVKLQTLHLVSLRHAMLTVRFMPGDVSFGNADD